MNWNTSYLVVFNRSFVYVYRFKHFRFEHFNPENSLFINIFPLFWKYHLKHAFVCLSIIIYYYFFILFYFFTGVFLAKALQDGRLVDLPLSTPFLKLLCQGDVACPVNVDKRKGYRSGSQPPLEEDPMTSSVFSQVNPSPCKSYLGLLFIYLFSNFTVNL